MSVFAFNLRWACLMFRLVRQVRVCLLLSLTACSSVYMKLDKTSIQNNKNKPTATESNNQPGVEPINQPTHLSSHPTANRQTDRQTGRRTDKQSSIQDITHHRSHRISGNSQQMHTLKRSISNNIECITFIISGYCNLLAEKANLSEKINKK